MNSFTYSYPVKVHFGDKVAADSLRTELKKYGRNVLFAYGGGAIKRVGIYDEIIAVLKEADKNIIEFSGIMPNPTYAKVQEGARLAKENKIDFILAVGGGSVIDCCKIVSAQAKLEEDIWNFEYGKGGQPTEFIPMGAVVTSFGTGAEMNNGAVVTNEDKMVKSPLWGAFYNFAVLDVGYTMTMPMKQVISGSFDTLSHCMETYFGSPRETNLSDEINEAVMRNVIKNIRSTLNDPDDRFVRSEPIWAAAMGENGILKLGKVTDFQCHMLEH
ncbi:MAG: iron-containing alcohol dehydrogenase, partial [Ruminococcus sp.]|nr:iron-containing alcohol dehydrogenase [Ruminococcus sp.]